MEEKRFTLRMDGELFDEISELASIHRRSAAKEIECAVAKYIHDHREKEILDDYRKNEPDSTGKSDEYMKRILEIHDKYKVFE